MYIPEYEYETSINEVIDEIMDDLLRLQNERLRFDQIYQDELRELDQEISRLFANNANKSESVNWTNEGF